MVADMAGKTRMKVLPDVTVSKLETAIEKGMEGLRHRSLDRCLAGLDDMTWKTALATHASQLCSLEPLLRELLKVCQNGMLPNANLLKDLQASHERKSFEAVRPSHALGNQWFQSLLSFFMLRLRMLTGKLRDLATDKQLRTVFFKKASSHQQGLVLGLLRIIKPELEMNLEDLAGEAEESTAGKVEEDLQSEDEREIERNFLLFHRPKAVEQALVPVSAPKTPSAPSSGSVLAGPGGFMQKATKRALEAAFATSPAKPMSKEERLQALQASAPVKKRPSMKRPAASLPAAAAEPAVPAAAAEVEARGDPEDLLRWGCSKCRSLVYGCRRCRDFALRGHNRYVRTADGKIYRKNP